MPAAVSHDSLHMRSDRAINNDHRAINSISNASALVPVTVINAFWQFCFCNMSKYRQGTDEALRFVQMIGGFTCTVYNVFKVLY